MARRQQKSKSLPTESDINVFDSLDERSAVDRFLGKWRDEIEARCSEGFAMRVIHDLRWMGYPAFAYYVEAVVNYLKSDASAEDSDAVNCFIGLIELRVAENPSPGPPWPSILRGVDHVLNFYSNYEVIEDIYGDLRSRYRAVRGRIQELAGQT
ncbi:hypothetical protein Pan44_30380 [Caulifigura coniformis]|uniref:Uncharacterized protein n=1 Tax=Caulifigura coniformis TaxID=2527983 RepID=A0A517SFV4_9PLAN|nr:hypothetical protein [Caulifigura coniformis]QDT54997.1 hypothetical protein Pan44_30380 [Caulifigura coniformis]